MRSSQSVMFAVARTSLVAGAISLAACSSNPDPEPGPGGPSGRDDHAAMLAYIMQYADVADVQTPTDAMGEVKSQEAQESVENGKEVVCTVTSYDITQTPSEIIAFQPNAGVVWPGALVDGATVPDGAPALIPLPRAPMVLTIDVPSSVTSQMISAPAAATVTEAIVAMVAGISGPTPARLSYQRREFYTLDQAMLGLGMSARWMSGSARASLDQRKSQADSSIIVQFTQAYYAVSAAPPADPTRFFTPAVTLADLQRVAPPDNQPGYISSVTYGRMLVVSITGTATTEQLRAAADFAYKGPTFSADANVRAEAQKTLNASTVTVVAVGGKASDAVKVITGSNLPAYFQDGENATPDSPGLPIAYTVRYLRNNRLANLAYTTSYTLRKCKTKQQVVRVTFDRVHIDKDCDALSDGAGDFYYEFKVNADVVTSRPRESNVGVSSGNPLALNASHNLTLDRASGTTFTVSGWLKERDKVTSGEDDDLGSFTHSFSFDDNKWRLGNHAHEFRQGNGCRGTLHYTSAAVN